MSEHHLLRHLSLAVLLKLLAVGALWWWLIRDHHVPVNVDSAAAHLIAPPAVQTKPPQAKP